MNFEWKIASEINSSYIKTIIKYQLTICESSWFGDVENN